MERKESKWSLASIEHLLCVDAFISIFVFISPSNHTEVEYYCLHFIDDETEFRGN